MVNPTMLLAVKEEYQSSENKVREIANKIEMLEFGLFVSNMSIFYEGYVTPIHPDFATESKIYATHVKMTPDRPPKDITQWVIRFEIIRDQLILKSINIESIIIRLKILYPGIYWVWTHETSKVLIIRGHVRNLMLKSGPAEKNVINIMSGIIKSNIRGIQGIKQAIPKRVKTSIIDAAGSIQSIDTWMIVTSGTNLPEILKHPDFDPYKCQSDSLQEMTDIFGIVCSTRKITSILLDILNGASELHASIYASEMAYLGYLTPLNRAGLQKRIPANVSERASYGYPIMVYSDAAARNVYEERNGISASIMAGSPPRIGTASVDVIINEEMIDESYSTDDL
jgi:DNA-directed RNA polymerase beta' subunit